MRPEPDITNEANVINVEDINNAIQKLHGACGALEGVVDQERALLAYALLSASSTEPDIDVCREAVATAEKAVAEWEAENTYTLNMLGSVIDGCYSEEILIRDSYLETYLQEMVRDYSVVDLTQTAEELKQQYNPVDYAGVTYYYRS